LIVNETEAIALIGSAPSGDWLGIARRLRELGPTSVVITLGGDGAVAAIGDDLVRVPAPPVKVVDTTGAGDAFCGAFAARLAGGRDAVSALKAGIAAGSLAVTVEGAQRSMPRRVEVERLAATIVVERIGDEIRR
jgi:ribokinase